MSVDADDIRRILIYVFVLIVSVALHEFGHAIMATWLGDDTPRRQGRVTLNPLAHADPIGTLLLPIVGGLYAAANHGLGGGFGWGKPVQWQPSRIDRKWHMSTARILVSAAGPMMNILLGTLIAFVHVILLHTHVLEQDSKLNTLLIFAVQTNFILFFFNLIPAPPLDGGGIVEGLTPYKHRSTFENFARFGPFILMAVVFIPALARIFSIPAGFCVQHVYNAFAALIGT